MNSNPYSHLLDQNQNQNQPTLVTQPQQKQQYQEQVNPQAYVFNPQNPQQQQYVYQQQQDPQYSTHSPHTVLPLNVAMYNQQMAYPITTTDGITNKNSFMFTIVIIYILQYIYQLGFVALCSSYHTQDNAFLYNNQVTGLFWFVLILTIVTPMIIFNVKALQNNPQSAIFVIIYLIIYAAFQLGMITVSNKRTYDKNGDSKQFGDYFWLALFEVAQLSFNYLGLLQLIVLAIFLKVKGDNFKFLEFHIVGVIVSALGGIPFYSEGKIVFIFMAAACGLLFTFWFSFGLKRVSDSNFGLKQEQAVFGSLSVFVVMVCPCVTKA